MRRLVEWLDKTLYPNHKSNWDDQMFREEIINWLKPSHCVLDLGAGAGIVSQMNFKGLAKRICGVDPDLRVVSNPNIDEGVVGYGEKIPYPDSSFDLVLSDNVLEHLENPEVVLKEIKRVLKQGGVFLAKTPNKNHYVTLISKLTPLAFHKFYNKMKGRCEADSFSTFYKINCYIDVNRYANQSGLGISKIYAVEGRPEYLRISWPLYFLGWLYERLVNSSKIFEPFRVVLIMVLHKN